MHLKTSAYPLAAAPTAMTAADVMAKPMTYMPDVKDQCRNVEEGDANINLPLAAAVILEDTSNAC